MKRILYITSILLLFCIVSVNAQKNVGIGTTSPDNSAVLDIQSSDKGLLIPRMTIEQRNQISNAADGLILYQTNGESGFYYFSKNSWKPLSSATEAKSIAADPDDWTMSGNSAPVGSFLGTTNNRDLVFKRFGVLAGTIGSSNTSLGLNTLEDITTGTLNVAIGRTAGANITSGFSNMALGANALRDNTEGSDNMAIGVSSLLSNVTGNKNTAIGSYSLQFGTNGIENTAIGYYAGRRKEGTGNVYIGANSGSVTALTSESNQLYIANSSTPNPLIKGDFSANTLKINSKTTGYLAVGDWDATLPMPTPTGYRLIVQDGVLTEKVKVAVKTTADWADYVFEDDYKLLPLSEVEEFTLENKHLPNVPSAEEMSNSGLDVGQTSKMFMEKIEELTLYLIQLNKEVQALKVENELLKTK